MHINAWAVYHHCFVPGQNIIAIRAGLASGRRSEVLSRPNRTINRRGHVPKCIAAAVAGIWATFFVTDHRRRENATASTGQHCGSCPRRSDQPWPASHAILNLCKILSAERATSPHPGPECQADRRPPQQEDPL